MPPEGQTFIRPGRKPGRAAVIQTQLQPIRSNRKGQAHARPPNPLQQKTSNMQSFCPLLVFCV
jgi:hypothetical protein